MIRKVVAQDIPHLIRIDREAYDKYGADEKYFRQKFAAQNTTILVVEEPEGVSGFMVFELLGANEFPPDFKNLKLKTSLNANWIHVIAFTTKTNYKDVEADTALLRSAENSGKNLGYSLFGVPLTVEHPFEKNDVFGFWEKNGYHQVGTIDWKAGPNELLPCYLYLKAL